MQEHTGGFDTQVPVAPQQPGSPMLLPPDVDYAATPSLGVELNFVREYMKAHHPAASATMPNTPAETAPKSSLISRIKARLPAGMLQYWKRSVDADYGPIPKPGRDLYIYIIIVQLFMLVWILLGYRRVLVVFKAVYSDQAYVCVCVCSSFAEIGQGISAGLTSNRLSGQMVLHFILQIFVIITDRVAYNLRSLVVKVCARVMLCMCVQLRSVSPRACNFQAVLHSVTLSYVHYKIFYSIPLATGMLGLSCN